MCFSWCVIFMNKSQDILPLCFSSPRSIYCFSDPEFAKDITWTKARQAFLDVISLNCFNLVVAIKNWNTIKFWEQLTFSFEIYLFWSMHPLFEILWFFGFTDNLQFHLTKTYASIEQKRLQTFGWIDVLFLFMLFLFNTT